MNLMKSARNIALSLFITSAALMTGCEKDTPEPVKPTPPPTTKPDPKPVVSRITNILAADSIVTNLSGANNSLAALQATGKAKIMDAKIQGTGTMEIVNLYGSSAGDAEVKVMNGYSYLTFPKLQNNGTATPSEADKAKYPHLVISEKKVSGIDTTYTTTYALLNQKGAYLAIKDPNINTVEKFASKMKSSTVLITGLNDNKSPGTENVTGPNAPKPGDNGTDPGGNPGENPGGDPGNNGGYAYKEVNVVINGGLINLDDSHTTLQKARFTNANSEGFTFAEGNGNVKMELVNEEKGNITVEDVMGVKYIHFSNISKSTSFVANPADSVKNVFVRITQKDEAKKQITMYRLFPRDGGGAGAASIGFMSNKAFTSNPNASWVDKTLKRDNLRVLAIQHK